MSAPPNKRQKLDIKEDNEDDDILDLTQYENTNNKSKKKLLLSNEQKLAHLGGINDDYGLPINILTIKYELFDVKLCDKDIIKHMIMIYNGEKSAFAKGMNHFFMTKKGKNGRMYKYKVKYNPKAPWASKVPKGGGSAAKYTPIEELLFEACCILIVTHGHRFGIVPEAGILGKDNVRIFADFYRILTIRSGYAELYPFAVFMRDHQSLRKKLKSYTDQWTSKKITCPKSMKIKVHFGGWPLKYKIEQSNEACLLKARDRKMGNDENTNSLNIVKNKKTKGTTNVLHEIRAKLVNMTDTLESNIKNSSTTNSLQYKSMSQAIPPILAMPPSNLQSNNTDNMIYKEEKDESEYDSMLVYEFIDQIEACVVGENITSEKGEQLTDLVLLSYHDPNKHKRTQNLIKFINKKGNIIKYLSLIEKDLNL